MLEWGPRALMGGIRADTSLRGEFTVCWCLTLPSQSVLGKSARTEVEIVVDDETIFKIEVLLLCLSLATGRPRGWNRPFRLENTGQVFGS